METHVHERSRPHTCPFCHDELGGETWTCPACHTAQHLDCARENGRCTSLGCGGRFAEEIHYHPRPAWSRRRRMALLVAVAVTIALLPLLLAWLLPGVAAAFWSLVAHGTYVRPQDAMFNTLIFYGIVIIGAAIGTIMIICAGNRSG